MAPTSRRAAPSSSDTPTKNLYKTRFSQETFSDEKKGGATDSKKSAATAAPPPKILGSGSTVPTGLQSSQEQVGAPGAAASPSSSGKQPDEEAYILATMQMVIARMNKMDTRMKVVETRLSLALTPRTERRPPRDAPGDAAIPATIHAKERAVKEFNAASPFGPFFAPNPKPAIPTPSTATPRPEPLSPNPETRQQVVLVLPGAASRFGFVALSRADSASPFH
ncbi:hypothetical protein T484DRAFT_1755999 [Baffinella frigidus]|nr:hypothetical protein T484DRAFT_1755999 [Cryptophyta sp. CCMP2293]